MRITFVAQSLACGGAERVMVNIAEGLVGRGHEVALATLYDEETDFFSPPTGVTRISFGTGVNSPLMPYEVRRTTSEFRALRRAVCSTRPDVVISFLKQINILTLLALTGTPYPTVVSERSDPAMDYSGRLWEGLRRITYPRAAKVVSVSRGVDGYFSWLPESQRAVIYNPRTHVEGFQDVPKLPPGVNENKHWIVAMGRLVHQKGFDILLPAFQTAVAKHADWQLLILGEGELRTELERMIDNLNLSHCVFLPGSLRNPFPVLKRAELFVLSSRYEGFANVLIEAMACGVPVVSTDCPSGPGEIINNGENGVLVAPENAAALATAMDRLMADEAERKRLAACGTETIKRFDKDLILDEWEALLHEVVTGRGAA